MAAKRGKFIVIDGMDGSGKGTQLALLRGKLKGYPVLYTREPGGTELAEEIRTMLLRIDGPKRTALADFFLFWAARASHVEDTVEPALAAGKHIICDRYDSSTWAFQIFGEQQEKFRKLFDEIRDWLPMQYRPDAYFFLDLPAKVAYDRVQRDAGREKSRFDLKSVEYHERVRNGFSFFMMGGARVRMVDADRPPDVINKELVARIREMLAE